MLNALLITLHCNGQPLLVVANSLRNGPIAMQAMQRPSSTLPVSSVSDAIDAMQVNASSLGSMYWNVTVINAMQAVCLMQ